ncbi:MAG TPA: hypothetical protein VJP80_08705, partial [Candidatus Saccharimonadales bacterium]|nr:hypothetical protein [Candidatus Saccharimonadales bacterium]
MGNNLLKILLATFFYTVFSTSAPTFVQQTVVVSGGPASGLAPSFSVQPAPGDIVTIDIAVRDTTVVALVPTITGLAAVWNKVVDSGPATTRTIVF